MQPKQDIKNTQNDVGTSAANTPITSASTVPPTENIMAQGVLGGSRVSGEKKNKISKKHIAGLVVLSLIAVGGVLFGVFGINSQNEQIAELKGRVSDADEKVAQLETEVAKNDDVVIDDEVEIVDDVNVVAADAVDTADYIYVGEWGIKIKIGDDLRLLGMSWYNVEKGGDYRLSIAASYSDSFADASIQYTGPNGFAFPHNFIVRTKDSHFAPYAFMGINDELQPVYNDGKFNYFVYQPTGFSTEGVSDPEALISAYNELFAELSKPENYSAI